MALIPLIDLAHLAALLGVRPWQPDDDVDLAELRDLLARRTALAEHWPVDPPPAGDRPRLHVGERTGGHAGAMTTTNVPGWSSTLSEPVGSDGSINWPG